MAPPPSGAGALVGRRLGKYEILALIALGGTAEIYLARIGGEAGFEKYVVVKVLHDHLADDQEFVRMFLDEARLGAQLEHSNIVQTLELGQSDGRYFMVMEYLAGMSLAMVARKAQQRVQGGRMPVELVLGLAAQACAGLHYMHEKRAPDNKPLNMVHRDISPQNLVISFEGMLKIVDFGIAKARVRETHTKSGTIKGKFAYMSPEQCLAQQVDRRTDIFAMGTLIHELLTGRRLFKRQSTYETYQAIIAGKVSPPSATNHELDPALDSVVMRALAYKKEDRYRSAEELGEALVGMLHRRGKSVSAGDVARFFDSYFDQEIQEHGQRMRELIEGRQQASEELTWHAPDAESDAAARMPDDMAVPPQTMDAGMDTTDDEIQGEATRIELNPLERVQNMHNQQSQPPAAGSGQHDDSTKIQQPRGRRGNTPAPGPAPKPAAGGRTIGFGSNALKAPASFPRAPSAPSRAPSAAPVRPPGMKSSGPAMPSAPQRAPSAPLRPPGAPVRPPGAPAGGPPGQTTAKPQDRTLFGAAAPKLPQTPPAGAAGGKAAVAEGMQRKATRQAQGGVPMPLPASPSPAPQAPPMQAGADDKTMMPDDLPFGQAMSPDDIRAAAAQVANGLPPQGAPPAAARPGGPPPGQVGPPPGYAGPPPGQAGPPPGYAGPPPGQAGPPPGYAGPPPGHAGPPPGHAPHPPGPPGPGAAGPQGKGPGAPAFPEVRTPTAFKARAELLHDTSGAPSGDMALLASERATTPGSPTPMLVVTFIVAAAVGLGITVLIGKLVM